MNAENVRKELQRLIEEKDTSTLGFFLSENESYLDPDEFENALEVLQNLIADEEYETGNVEDADNFDDIANLNDFNDIEGLDDFGDLSNCVDISNTDEIDDTDDIDNISNNDNADIIYDLEDGVNLSNDCESDELQSQSQTQVVNESQNSQEDMKWHEQTGQKSNHNVLKVKSIQKEYIVPITQGQTSLLESDSREDVQADALLQLKNREDISLQNNQNDEKYESQTMNGKKDQNEFSINLKMKSENNNLVEDQSSEQMNLDVLSSIKQSEIDAHQQLVVQNPNKSPITPNTPSSTMQQDFDHQANFIQDIDNQNNEVNDYKANSNDICNNLGIMESTSSMPPAKHHKKEGLLSRELKASVLRTLPDQEDDNGSSNPSNVIISKFELHDSRKFSYNLTPPYSGIGSMESTEDLTDVSQLSGDESEKGPLKIEKSQLKIETALGPIIIQDYTTPTSEMDEDDFRLTTLQKNLWNDSSKAKKLLFHIIPSMDDYHPLLGKLDSLLVSLNLHLYHNPEIKYLTKDTPYLSDALNTLSSILGHRTKPSLFGNVKNLMQILYKLRIAKDHLFAFEQIHTIRNMSKQLIQQKIILFLQFLLQRNRCMEVITELCTSLPLLAESFEKDSMLNDYSHRYQILQLVEKLCTHTFRFEFPPEIAISEQGILAQTQSFLKGIIKHLHEQEARYNLPVSTVASEIETPSIGIYFRSTFCRSIIAFLEHGKTKSLWLRPVTVWDVICNVAKLHPGAQCNGIELSTAIATLDEVVPFVDNNHIVSDKKQLYIDDKVAYFICYCLNYKMLQFFFHILFNDEITIKKYYRPEAMIRKSAHQTSYICFASICEKIPFSFRIGAI